MRIKIGSRVRVKSEPNCLRGVVVGYDYLDGRRIYHVEIFFDGFAWFYSSALEVLP